MLRERSNTLYAVHFMVQIVVSNIIQVEVPGYESVLSVKARERRYMIKGVTHYQLGRAKMGIRAKRSGPNPTQDCTRLLTRSVSCWTGKDLGYVYQQKQKHDKSNPD